MNIQLRPYRADEYERAAEIRQINDIEHLERWRKRMENSGKWDDHYLHLAIEVDGELAGDLQVRHCKQAMPDGVLELGLELATEMQGKGIGTEVLKLAAERFFAEGVHRISGSTDVRKPTARTKNPKSRLKGAEPMYQTSPSDFNLA